jgi:hypothetical protein
LAALWEEVAELERSIHYHRKRMATAFFNGTVEYVLNILPQSRSMDAEYFAEESIGGLEDVYYPEGRNSHERRITVHSDNALIHNARTVMG